MLIDVCAQIEMASSGNSRKGTSITHLMNWDVPSDYYHNHHQFRSRTNQRRNPTWGLGSGYHAVDKARYDPDNQRKDHIADTYPIDM